MIQPSIEILTDDYLVQETEHRPYVEFIEHDVVVDHAARIILIHAALSPSRKAKLISDSRQQIVAARVKALPVRVG